MWVWVCILLSRGTFSCPTPILMIGSSLGGASSLLNSVSFHTSHIEDPWILPSSSTSSVPIKTSVLLPAIMVAYQVNLDKVVEPSPSSSWMEEESLIYTSCMGSRVISLLRLP